MLLLLLLAIVVVGRSVQLLWLLGAGQLIQIANSRLFLGLRCPRASERTSATSFRSKRKPMEFGAANWIKFVRWLAGLHNGRRRRRRHRHRGCLRRHPRQCNEVRFVSPTSRPADWLAAASYDDDDDDDMSQVLSARLLLGLSLSLIRGPPLVSRGE